jgi:hypothetical protein
MGLRRGCGLQVTCSVYGKTDCLVVPLGGAAAPFSTHGERRLDGSMTSTWRTTLSRSRCGRRRPAVEREVKLTPIFQALQGTRTNQRKQAGATLRCSDYHRRHEPEHAMLHSDCAHQAQTGGRVREQRCHARSSRIRKRHRRRATKQVPGPGRRPARVQAHRALQVCSPPIGVRPDSGPASRVRRNRSADPGPPLRFLEHGDPRARRPRVATSGWTPEPARRRRAAAAPPPIRDRRHSTLALLGDTSRVDGSCGWGGAAAP